ncbi:MAG: PilZ domain-containing protein [Desulfobacterales bacterium]
MGESDKRQYTRVETCNLISYACCDDAGRTLKQGMGRALDISQNGLLLECGSPIDSERISLMSADPDDRLIEIEGVVAYSRRSPDGYYRVGIRFSGLPEENVRFAASLIKTFHYRRRKNAGGKLSVSPVPD